jgi:predicted Fe-Mo cluster-binding NifX family protein
LGLIEQLPLVSGGILVIILAAFLFSRYELKVGLQVGSPSLVADAKHVTTDVLSSLVILFGIVGTYFGYDIDRYVALFVAVVVAHVGYQILIESLKVQLDATLDYPTLDGIRRILESNPDVTEVVSLGGRSSGRYKFVEVTLRMDIKLLREAHRITSQLEEEILDRWPNIDKILVHYEPEQKEFELVATPLDVPPAASPGPQSRVSGHFGEAPYFGLLLKDLRKDAVSIESFAENPFKTLERRKGVKVAEFLAEKGVDQVRIKTDLEGTGAAYALEAMGIDVVHTDAETLGEVVSQIERDS